MKFDTIQDCLRWFFNRSWIRPPADARSMPPLKISTSPRMENTEHVMAAHMRIKRVIDSLNGRDQVILLNEFHRRGRSQTEVAEYYGLEGGDRSIRYIRDKLLENLEERLQQEGLISIPVYQEPVRAKNFREV